MDQSYIKIKGARQHNLKNISVDIPKGKLVVFTGVSGSGKSSLAFDTIYAEGQRRYVESLSSYARQFLGVMDKPDVDFIEGLSPAISIDQKTTSHNPRSTVGTVTEIYDYLRLLFARIGHPHCPICGREIKSLSIDEIVNEILASFNLETKEHDHVRFLLLSPIVKDRKGEFSELLTNIRSKGIRSVRIDGHIKSLDEDFVLIKTNRHTIEAVVDRITVRKKQLRDTVAFAQIRERLNQSCEQALSLSEGYLIISKVLDSGFDFPEAPKKMADHLYSERFMCPVDTIALEEIEPRTFSFNSPHGACPKCTGLGKIQKVESSLIFSPELSIAEGAILPFSTMFEHDTWYSRIIKTVAQANSIDIHVPVRDLPQAAIDVFLFGTGERLYTVEGTNKEGRYTKIHEAFKGIVAELERRYKESQSDYVRGEIEKYMREIVCPECEGSRLKKESRSITVTGQPINVISTYSIKQSLDWVDGLLVGTTIADRERLIAKPIVSEIRSRLSFLVDVGLDYISLDRRADSLAGGEAQRIRLASQIGSGLTGVLYVLDEPTIGLHPKDNDRLIDTLKRLRDLDNSVIVVEHDEEMMKQSDLIVDFGPAAGKNGGKIVAMGTPTQIMKDPKSITGPYLSGKKKIKPIASQPTLVSGELVLTNASQYNLKGVTLTIPLGKLVSVTGVSGSGKSTLVVDTLYHAVAGQLNHFHKIAPGSFDSITGLDNVARVVLVDQSPIGRTPRSNPATYTKVFDLIRDVFALSAEARLSGYTKGRFSFNVKGGRCENCEGQGQIKIEMQFMSDIWVTCEVCNGTRYNRATLDVMYKGKTIADILKMSVTDAREFFHNHPQIASKLDTLYEVGLDYMELGQSATTLSGGEAQRVKLATELSKRGSAHTLYILDEPTTGLHFADLQRLLNVLKMLVNRGNTVVVIEHNLDVIKNSDWIIDLGPLGGDKGGQIIAQGTPGKVASVTSSFTGQYLKKVL